MILRTQVIAGWIILALAGIAATAADNPPSHPGKPAVERTSHVDTDPFDDRLAVKITLASKGVSLEELCRRIEDATHVKLEAARGVGDENVTVFVDGCPARLVMREVARLFGFFWVRSGEAGKFRYTLTQDLRSQLAEEELRNQDVHAAFLALDEQMGRFQPYLRLTPDQARARLANTGTDEKSLLTRYVENWGAVQIYQRLTGAQRLALSNGEALEFEPNAADPDRRIPPDMAGSVLQTIPLTLAGSPGQFYLAPIDPKDGVPLTHIPSAQPIVQLSLQRKELGEIWLMESHGAALEWQGEAVRSVYAGLRPIAIGKSPTTAEPDNARENAGLRTLPVFQKKVSFSPDSSCPQFAPGAPRRQPALPYYVSAEGVSVFGQEPAHGFSGDVWEAVHHATGLPTVADCYSHVYPLASVAVKDRPLFEALNHVSGAMRARWRKDGEFLLGRSSSFFWDKVKEVPQRQLRRWQHDRNAHNGLPLDDLLEMARLRDEQLDSAPVGKVIEHCWGLDEWGAVGNSGFRMGLLYSEMLPFARFLAALSPAQLAAAHNPGGVEFQKLSPAQQELIARPLLRWVHTPLFFSEMTVHFDYASTGDYVWRPEVNGEEREKASLTWPMVTGPSPEAALDEARKWDPDAKPSQIRKSNGVLQINCQSPNGRPFRMGGPF